MTNRTPTEDGQLVEFKPTDKCYASLRTAADFYYVNGIATTGEVHQQTAETIANITESLCRGIYNRTSGMGADLFQCSGDWLYIFRSQLGEEGFLSDRLSQAAINSITSIFSSMRHANPFLHAIREAWIAPSHIQPKRKKVLDTIRDALRRNPASLRLFDELGRCSVRPQIVVAHSQGNLITSSAVWALQAAYGSRALANIHIRSISSPAPAWPRGINNRIKVYGQKDDIVTMFDPKNLTGNRSPGSWGFFSPKAPVEYVKTGSIAAHDVEYNIFQTNLARRLRNDAGIQAF
jgi:hypothetical protein